SIRLRSDMPVLFHARRRLVHCRGGDAGIERRASIRTHKGRSNSLNLRIVLTKNRFRSLGRCCRLGPEVHMKLHLKRVYDPKSEKDGMRVLVDRLWPRGLSKQEAAVDLWVKDVAPSTELRRWYHAHMDEWPEFRKRYEAELTA